MPKALYQYMALFLQHESTFDVKNGMVHVPVVHSDKPQWSQLSTHVKNGIVPVVHSDKS